MSRVFVSYSSKDRTLVNRLASDLRSQGAGIWLDLWELLPGDSLKEKIGAAIVQHDYFVIVLTPNSVASTWVSKELGVALIHEIETKSAKIIPVLLQECSIPPLLKDKVYADFRHDYSAGLMSLLRVVAPREPSRVNTGHLSTPVGDSNDTSDPRIVRDIVLDDNIIDDTLIDNTLIYEQNADQ